MSSTRPSRWRRRPGRRIIAAAVVAAIAASGLTYAGLSDSGERAQPEAKPRHSAPLSHAEAAAKAARTGKTVEVTSLRTAYETTWARPDGLTQRRIHSSPIRAKVDGTWRAIDTSLGHTKDGWSPRATNTRMKFSAGTDSRGQDDRADRGAGALRVPLLAQAATAATGNALVTLTTGGHDIVLTWPYDIPTPIIDGSRALYPEILPGADLVLTADDGGFAQLLVLKTRVAAADPRVTQLSYGLSSPDLSFSLDPTTGIISAEDSTGDEVAVSPTPLMWDSSGTPALTNGQAGSSASPTASESLSEDESSAPDESESPTESPEPSDTSDYVDSGDTAAEVLPDASDEAPDPSTSEGEGANPSVPAEASPDPTHSGASATLDLPSLAGPQPDSKGTLIETDLNGSTWTLTPDREFLDDADTVYPVFVDPSIRKHHNDWTTAYSRHPNANFYNGRNFNQGTSEARVGFESDTWGTSRSFFTMDWNPDLKGSSVTTAKLHILETYSWSCSPRTVNVYVTGPISNKTTWRNAPSMTAGNKLAGKSFAHGYKSATCPDEYEEFDVKRAAQKAISDGADSLTLGLRAGDENSAYSWKKFQANDGNGPYIELVYNRPPGAPTRLDLDPDLSCDTIAPYVNVGASSITFWANATDKDNNLASLRFELWPTNGSGNLLGSKGIKKIDGQVGSTREHTEPFSTSGLKNGTTYSWRVRAMDKAGVSSSFAPAKSPYCRFVFDSSRPTPPVVTSVQFPNADGNNNGLHNEPEDAIWSKVKFGSAGSFVFRASQTDVVKYEFAFNTPTYTASLPRLNGAATSTTTTWNGAKPPLAGPNVLYVRAVDDAGHVSDPRKYFFYITPRDKADTAGDFTGDAFADLMVVTATGDLWMYPSRGNSDLTKGTGTFGPAMSGAYRENPAKDPNGNVADGEPLYVGPVSGYWKNTMVAHLGDIYGGDGLQDLVAVREGKLWVYPGDGYGAVNIDKRQEILLPAGGPNLAAVTQIVSSGDATGDGKPDFFLTVKDSDTVETLWALTGYNGATVEAARALNSGPAWATRDLVNLQDITGDGVTDMLYRIVSSGRLALRTGIKDSATGGVSLDSLATSGAAAGGVDNTDYATSGWTAPDIKLAFGTADADGDAIPDIWAVTGTGAVRFYPGGRSALGAFTAVPSGGWSGMLTLG
ncbi:DNRLRE domain-containing protein [Streptomyces sp. B21-083]|uniref:DNRLRE domain-containing protein n=1 Tax=Streptomyces sp. B21-083 TaxID=3039410 RepID=UPI002FF1BA00